jgi:hypothetical protein
MSVSLSLPRPYADIFLGAFSEPEEGDDTFFRNIRLSPNYTALQPKKRYCTLSSPRESHSQPKHIYSRLFNILATDSFLAQVPPRAQLGAIRVPFPLQRMEMHYKTVLAYYERICARTFSQNKHLLIQYVLSDNNLLVRFNNDNLKHFL